MTETPKRPGRPRKHPEGTTDTDRARLSRAGKTQVYLPADVTLMLDQRVRQPGEDRPAALSRLVRDASR